MARLAMLCGLVSLVLLVGGTIIAGAVTPGYDHLRQYMSELGATGAPTGPWVSYGVFLPSSALMVVFWLYCARRLAPGPVAAIGFVFLAMNGLGLAGGGAFPCEVGCPIESASLSQNLHNLFGGLGYLAGVIGLFISAIGMSRGDRKPATIATGLTCAIAGAVFLTGIHPDFEYPGAAQRGLEACFVAWTLACILAIRRQTAKDQAAKRPPLAA